MRQRCFRVIYMVEQLSEDRYDIIVRRFACNKRIAERIARQLGDGLDIIITKLAKREWQYVDMRDVER